MSSGRLMRRLTYAEMVLSTAVVLGFVASVGMMIAEHAPVFCREMGAIFLAATALFTAMSIIHFKIVFSLRRTVASQERIMESKERIIELLQERVNGNSPRKGHSQ